MAHHKQEVDVAATLDEAVAVVIDRLSSMDGASVHWALAELEAAARRVRHHYGVPIGEAREWRARYGVPSDQSPGPMLNAFARQDRNRA